MKHYRRILRIIWGLVIVCLITLFICVVRLSRSSDNEGHPTLTFSVNKLVIADGKETLLPWFDFSKQEEEDETAEEESSAEEELLPIAEFQGELPRIVCWGDSLTESSDRRTAYPDVLRELSGTEVVNYGIRSDTTLQVALRAGAVGIYAGECVIPAETVPVEVSLRTKSGNSVSLLRYGDGGINPCSLGGVRGRLDSADGSYYFTRSSPGSEVYVESGTRLTTAGMAGKNKDDVLVIFTGTNDRPNADSIYDIISLQRRILEYTGCEKYVVIGMTCKEIMPEIEEVNEILAQEYQNNFLDIREYMLQYGLEAEGLKATAGDLEDIRNGEIPRSLRTDYVHGNAYFYDILARKLYERLEYLGYLPNESTEL
ncbi:MAG: hypothetical protein IJ073_06455 [Lachnospiraceae bacterium]|nr:hypothetical protein [Lachnospiraceae bacterium]